MANDFEEGKFHMTKTKLLKKALGLTAAAVALCALIGCSGESQAESTGESSPSNPSSETSSAIQINDEMEELNVAVLGKDIKIAALIVADQEGFTEEEGLTLNYQTAANFSDAITGMLDGTLDVLPFGAIPTCTFVSQGEENLCVFGGTIAEGSECITLPENADKYTKLSDFDNAKIAYFPMETGHLVMQGLQKEAGTYNPDNWIIMSDQNAEMQAVLNGEVDCCFLNSGQGYVAAQQGLVTSMRVGDLQPDFPCCRQTTTMDNMNEKASALTKLLIAELRGMEFMQTNKEQAIQDLANYSGQSPEYCEAVIYSNDSYTTPMIVDMDPYTDAVCEFYDTMKATDNIDANTSYKMEDHVNSTLYKAALDTLIDRGENLDFYNDLLAAYNTHNTIGK